MFNVFHTEIVMVMHTTLLYAVNDVFYFNCTYKIVYNSFM